MQVLSLEKRQKEMRVKIHNFRVDTWNWEYHSFKCYSIKKKHILTIEDIKYYHLQPFHLDVITQQSRIEKCDQCPRNHSRTCGSKPT